LDKCGNVSNGVQAHHGNRFDNRHPARLTSEVAAYESVAGKPIGSTPELPDFIMEMVIPSDEQCHANAPYDP
jgi:hypothetical protein